MDSMKKLCTIAIIQFFAVNLLISQEFPLYTGPIPNSKPSENLEKTAINQWGTVFTTETSIPTLTCYTPNYPNGQAVIICPGGGYSGTAVDKEGKFVALSFANQGITAFVLKYRMPLERTCVDPSLAPLQDAQQAIRIVRKGAAHWGIDPNKIGIMGFSAGGHLASTAATHFNFKADASNSDTTSVRPDFAILIYPVISFSDSLAHGGSRKNLIGAAPSAQQIDFFSNEKQVTKDCPPAFLVHAQDDGAVPVGNSVAYFMACTRVGVLAEMHLYPKGGHGFGMHNPTTSDEWMERLYNFLKAVNQ